MDSLHQMQAAAALNAAQHAAFMAAASSAAARGLPFDYRPFYSFPLPPVDAPLPPTPNQASRFQFRLPQCPEPWAPSRAQAQATPPAGPKARGDLLHNASTSPFQKVALVQMNLQKSSFTKPAAASPVSRAVIVKAEPVYQQQQQQQTKPASPSSFSSAPTSSSSVPATPSGSNNASSSFLVAQLTHPRLSHCDQDCSSDSHHSAGEDYEDEDEMDGGEGDHDHGDDQDSCCSPSHQLQDLQAAALAHHASQDPFAKLQAMAREAVDMPSKDGSMMQHQQLPPMQMQHTVPFTPNNNGALIPTTPKRSLIHQCFHPGCGARFATHFSMKRHLKRHTGERPFECPFEDCGRRFAENSTLKRHLRTHTGDRPFVCPIAGCGKRFADRTNVRRHISTHGHKKEYMCPLANCGRSFVRKGFLAKHMMASHKNQPLDILSAASATLV